MRSKGQVVSRFPGVEPESQSAVPELRSGSRVQSRDPESVTTRLESGVCGTMMLKPTPFRVRYQEKHRTVSNVPWLGAFVFAW